jgi:hypothetical protein
MVVYIRFKVVGSFPGPCASKTYVHQVALFISNAVIHKANRNHTYREERDIPTNPWLVFFAFLSLNNAWLKKTVKCYSFQIAKLIYDKYYNLEGVVVMCCSGVMVLATT